MADFNPDAYLAKKKPGGFDPDAYLSKKPKEPLVNVRGKAVRPSEIKETIPSALRGSIRPSAKEQILGELGQQPEAEQTGIYPLQPGAVKPLPGVELAPTPNVAPEAAAAGLAQGLTGGYLDEAAGLLGALNVGDPDAPVSKPGVAARPLGEGYRKTREGVREYVEATQRLSPKAALAGEVVGSVASPLSKLGPGIRAGAKPVEAIARAGGRLAAQGAVVAGGESKADLTRGEAARLAKDVVTGGAVAGTIGLAGEGAAQVVKAGGSAVLRNLKKRLLNEAAEGTAATTPTARKHLAKAGDAIFDEIVHGPDGDTVRKALRGPADKGREALEPIKNQVGQTLEANYNALKARGVDVVDLKAFDNGLKAARNEAVEKGREDLMRGIDAYRQHVAEFAQTEGAGALTLMQLRGLTTQTQRAAASALGGLNEHATAKLKRQLSGLASVAMDDMLETAGTRGGKDAAAAVSEIRGLNKRYFALATLDDALERRVNKEVTGKSALVRGAEKISNPLAIAGGTAAATGLTSGDEDDVIDRLWKAAVLAAAGKAVPAAAKGIERATTTAGIKAARGQPVVPARAGVAFTRATAAAAARAAAKREEEEE